MREASVKRDTNETKIELKLNLDGSGECNIDSGVGFLDHMLTLFARHGDFDLELKCVGDTHVDDHHSVEDIAICLGEAFDRALGDRRGICRYADSIIPMDEALIMTVADISGRSFLNFELYIPMQKVGSFDTELVREFMEAFVRRSHITLHIKQLMGQNSHHIIEGAFKSLARTLKKAVSIDPAHAGEIPSTKGVL